MIPSAKSLLQVTGNNLQNARAVRNLLEECFNVTETLRAAEQFVLDSRGHKTTGVEYIPRGHNQKSPAIHYLNAGDPYVTTLLHISGVGFRVGCWGDYVERGNYD